MGSSTTVAVPRLQHWRISRALLQRELAVAAKVDVRTIQRLEAGGPAGLETIQHLAAALSVKPTDLMAER